MSKDPKLDQKIEEMQKTVKNFHKKLALTKLNKNRKKQFINWINDLLEADIETDNWEPDELDTFKKNVKKQFSKYFQNFPMHEQLFTDDMLTDLAVKYIGKNRMLLLNAIHEFYNRLLPDSNKILPPDSDSDLDYFKKKLHLRF